MRASSGMSASLGLARALALVALGYGLSLFFLRPPAGPCPSCSPPSLDSLPGDAQDRPAPRTLVVDAVNARDPATYAANIKALLQDVEAHADADVRERCLSMIRGDRVMKEGGMFFNSFAQAGQDWLLFHNYFSHIPYGKGSYIDIGSNDPYKRSNTFFFDRCLGWKGVCIEPNSDYYPLYEKHKRSCTLVKSCVAGHAMTRGMNFSEAEFGALRGEGTGQQVQCRVLSEVILTHGLQNADFASIDIEGAEFETLRCFPFRAHGIATWLVETNKADERLYRLFQRGGYSPVADVIMGGFSYKSDVTRVGIKLDTIFRLVSPTFILGPEFLPGRALDGKGARPSCKPDEGFPSRKCPEQVPVIASDEISIKDFSLKDGACGFTKNAFESEQGAADSVLPTARHPSVSMTKA